MNTKLFATLCVGLILMGGCLTVFGMDGTDAYSPGTSADRSSVLYGDAMEMTSAPGTHYVYVGAYVNITSYDDGELYFNPVSVTTGFGLTVSQGTLSGYIGKPGNITVTFSGTYGSDTVTINADYKQGSDITITAGQVWSYAVTTTVDTVDTHLTSTVNGPILEGQDEEELVVWVPSSTGNATLVLTARSSDPVQVDIQTINITVIASVTPVASTSAPAIYAVVGGSIPNTSREQVTTYTNIENATWSVQGTNNTGLTITSAGVIGGTAASTPGTHTITLQATDGTYSATVQLTVYIVAKLVITSVPAGSE